VHPPSPPSRQSSATSDAAPAFAGYSGTPLAKKLGIKAGHTLLLAGAPPGWEIPDLPPGVVIRRRPPRDGDLRADIVLAFYHRAADFRSRGPAMARRLLPTASLWAAWPRRAGGHVSDLTEQLLRDVLLPLGFVDVKVAALDDDWSGLKFVWRRAGRLPPA
jgi:hypothetical protein